MSDQQSRTIDDYDRGYRAGVMAASKIIAQFYQGLQEQDAKIARERVTAQEAMQRLILQRLEPLLDEIFSLILR